MSEAEEKLGCSKGKLLEYGASGCLQLCIKVPNGFRVWSMIGTEDCMRGLDFFSEKVMDRLPEERQSVTFLSLSKTDCEALGKPGYQDQMVFYSGYAENRFGFMDETTPDFKYLRPFRNQMLVIASRVFVLYPENSPPPEKGTSFNEVKRINLKEVDIFIADRELQGFLNSDESLPVDKFKPHTNTSEKLRLLNLVARELMSGFS